MQPLKAALLVTLLHFMLPFAHSALLKDAKDDEIIRVNEDPEDHKVWFSEDEGNCAFKPTSNERIPHPPSDSNEIEDKSGCFTVVKSFVKNDPEILIITKILLFIAFFAFYLNR
jgi:hypothetical protein